MKNSEQAKRQAKRIVHRIQELLEPQLICRLIDEPVDRAAEGFVSRRDAARSAREFHGILARFVTHVHCRLPGPARKLALPKARDLALALLEQGYQGTVHGGYEAALLEAVDTARGGLPLVLARVTQLLKDRLRREYVHWVFARNIDPNDWATRCAMAEVLMAPWAAARESLPGGTIPSPDRMVNLIPALIELKTMMEGSSPGWPDPGKRVLKERRGTRPA